ncbi:unnamed protein product, partial [Tetraodon nigroviridis]
MLLPGASLCTLGSARWQAAGPISLYGSEASPSTSNQLLGLDPRVVSLEFWSEEPPSQPGNCAVGMENTRCFANPFCDYKGALLPAQSVQTTVRVVLATVEKVLKQVPVDIRDCDGGLYDGPAGVAYMLYHVSQCPLFSEQRGFYLRAAKRIIDASAKCADAEPDKNMRAAFLLGGAGIYAVAALIYKSLGLGRLRPTAEQVPEPVGGVRARLLPGVRLGRAVRGPGWVPVRRPGPQAEAGDGDSEQRSDEIHLSGHHRVWAPVRQEEEEALPAHVLLLRDGVSGCGPRPVLGAADAAELPGRAERGGEGPGVAEPRLPHEPGAELQLAGGAGSRHPEGEGAGALVPRRSRYWLSVRVVRACVGLGPLTGCCPAGVAYLFAKAYLINKKPQYLDTCIRCGELVWQKGLLKKGPGICHGVAGSAYVFLLLYRLTGNRKYIYRAQRRETLLLFAEFLFTEEFKSGSRWPSSVCSLFEGLSGTVCFLVDLLQPEQAEFPLFSVFV